MKILLIGEYSNVHWTLAQGLRQLGHEVCVVSNGDEWKNYPRDVDISRRSTGTWDTLRYLLRLERVTRGLRGYDVVQLISPVFLDLKAERILPYYRRLKRQNGNIFMGAFGMDHYWVKAGMDRTTFRYSDFNMGRDPRDSEENDRFMAEWLQGPKGQLNQFIAHDCRGIVTGLYEYHMSYMRHFDMPEKVRYIPFPVPCGQDNAPVGVHRPLRFFIGIQDQRNAYKGTDIMLRALQRVAQERPDEVETVVAHNVPFAQYSRMMEGSDVLLDQLYSYTPAMNGLLAMSKGLVLVGGGEEEHYRLLGEEQLRPIVNVVPTEESVYKALTLLARNPQIVPMLKRQGLDYVQKHHDPVRVAQQYVDFWTKRMEK